MKSLGIASTRRRLGDKGTALVASYRISSGTLRNWARRRHVPRDGCALMRVSEREPETIRQALGWARGVAVGRTE